MSKKIVTAKNSENYIVTATADNFDYTLDYTSKNPNQKHAGTSPTGLLLSSLAGCQLMTARSFFNRNEIEINVLEVEITGDFNYTKENWKLRADAILFIDKPLQKKQETALIKFIERFCTVSGVLAPGNDLRLSISSQKRS